MKYIKHISIRKTTKKINVILVVMILMLSTVAINQANAQTLEASVYGQSTVMGFQKGFEMGFSTFKGLGISGFYQSTQVLNFENSLGNYPFLGLSLNVPFKQCDGLKISGQLRGGVVNGDFLILTPQIETSLALTRHLSAAINAGYRAGMPAVGISMKIKLNN